MIYLPPASPNFSFALSPACNFITCARLFHASMPLSAFLALKALISQLFCQLIPFPVKRTLSAPHGQLTTCSGLYALPLSRAQVCLSTWTMMEIDIKDT